MGGHPVSVVDVCNDIWTLLTSKVCYFFFSFRKYGFFLKYHCIIIDVIDNGLLLVSYVIMVYSKICRVIFFFALI